MLASPLLNLSISCLRAGAFAGANPEVAGHVDGRSSGGLSGGASPGGRLRIEKAGSGDSTVAGYGGVTIYDSVVDSPRQSARESGGL